MFEMWQFFSRHVFLTLLAMIVLILIAIVELFRARKNSFVVTPQQAIPLINAQNAAVIDIRPNDVYKKSHIINAISLSASDIKNQFKKIEKYKNKPVIIVDSAGLDSQKITFLLLKQGFNAFTLDGGMRAWVGAQMPVVKDS